MLELTVNSKSPAAISSALKKIKEMSSSGTISKESTIHLLIEGGTYRETIRYNLPNPIIFEGKNECIIQADNCEAFKPGVAYRSIISFGPNATNVTLKNMNIINLHKKNGSTISTPADAAEALCWDNLHGILTCRNMKFIGRQNTIFVKGNSLFIDSEISGDVDFIYGEPENALFEGCTINSIEDNRGDFDSYIVRPECPANSNGFIFKNCSFKGTKRGKCKSYVIRTLGKGSETSSKYWDNVALINCEIDGFFDPELIFDDDMNLELYPRGNAQHGVREMNSRTRTSSGKLEPCDTSRRNIRQYTLTNDDYNKYYATRYQILKNTKFFN